MSVTHADLAPSCRGTGIVSKTAAILMIFTALFGLICFILSLIAEATHSQVIWLSSTGAGHAEKYQCTYSSSGKTPLLCAAAAFVALAIAMVVEHTYMLVLVSKSTPMAFVTWDPDSDPVKSLTWQAGFFFVTTWICFAIGEILLLVGVSVESGHLKNWSTPRPNCLGLRQGLFSAAGVLGLTTVFLATGLYTTALRAQNLLQDQENAHIEALEASAHYASQPRHRMATVRNESPLSNEQELCIYMSDFDKYINSV